MSVNKRIQKIIDDKFSGNKRAFSMSIGVVPTAIENIVGNRKSQPNYRMLNKIAVTFENISGDWLLTGKGKMYIPEKTAVVSDGKNNNYGNVLSETAKPFFDSSNISLNITDAFKIAIDEENAKRIDIPFTVDYDFSLRIHGDSMVNNDNPKRSLRDEDIVICKLWEHSYFRWGEVYALVTNDGCIVKKIMQSETEGHIKCVSFNEKDYPAYDLPISEILDTAIVVGSFSVSAW